MCSRKLLAESPPSEFTSRLKTGRSGFGPLLGRKQVSLFVASIDGPGVHGTATSFEYSCEYRNASTMEALKVFEPTDGGPVEVEAYRFEVRAPKDPLKDTKSENES